VWFVVKSGSLWTGVWLHLSHNIFVQEVFNPITIDRGITTRITSEFGIGLAVAYGLIAFILWRRGGGPIPESSPNTNSSPEYHHP